jgi:periplasmic divalent cation tolerance protein
MSDLIVVFMTAASIGEARRIADQLVETRLAACVQLIPEMESVYRWQGEIQREKEVLMLAKTTADRFSQLEEAVREIHGYETPEILAVPASLISEPYRAWLIENVSGG